MPDYPQEGALAWRPHSGGREHSVGPSRRTKTARSNAKELEQLYLKGAGLTRRARVIAYCRIGERSSHTWFVLHYLLGIQASEELRRLVDRMGQLRRPAD